MSLLYSAAPTSGALRQGEILAGVWENRPLLPPKPIPRGLHLRVESVPHDLTVVLSPDCDLQWDYEMRFVSFLAEYPAKSADVNEHPSTVTHVLLCDLQNYDIFRPRFKDVPDVWRRVTQNQDERYHRLSAAAIESSELRLHDLFVDFKRVVGIRTDELYDGILGGGVARIAVIPPYYLHDIIHRFYGFLSRVAIPE
jgi:hypothetical protein